MTLPAFASVEQLASRVAGGIADDDLARAQGALDDASSKIRAEAGEAWIAVDEDTSAVTLDLPTDPEWAADVITRITLAVALRAFKNPEAVTERSEAVDGYNFSDQFANSSPDVYLTAAEKADLAKIAGGTSGLWTLATTRCDDTTATDLPAFAGDVYLEVEDSELIPFLPIDAGNGL